MVEERPLGILVAVQEELNPILKLAPLTPRLVEGVLAYTGRIRGRSVVVTKSGIGRRRAGQSADSLIRLFGCQSMLICGFAAGLTIDVKPGDLVLADRVIPGTEAVDDDHTIFADPASLVLPPMPPDIKTHVGAVLTYYRVVTTGAEKRDIASHVRALALDMESAGALEACETNGVKWSVVRAISDGLDDDLPLPFDPFINDRSGEVNRGRVISAVMIQPWKIPAVVRLGRRSTLAARNLAVFVEAYIAQFSVSEPESTRDISQ